MYLSSRAGRTRHRMRQSDTALQSNKLSPVSVHYWYNTDTLLIHYWYITDTLLLHYWYITDTVHYCYITVTLLIHYWYITDTLLIHYWYLTDALHTLHFKSEKEIFFISLSLVATLNFLERSAVPLKKCINRGKKGFSIQWAEAFYICNTVYSIKFF